MPERLIDIGVGENPYFMRFRTHCDATHYVGVDSDEYRAGVARSQLAVPSPLGRPETAEVILADATRLPFSEESFSMAVLSNILSAPIHRRWSVDSVGHIVRGFAFQDPFYLERKRVILEALRVLQPGGRLIIYTDLIVYAPQAYDMIIRELWGNPRLAFKVLEEEQRRVDDLNIEKVRSGDYCFCFLADLLPASSVYEVTKLR